LTEFEQPENPAIQENSAPLHAEPAQNSTPAEEEPDLAMFQAVPLIHEPAADTGLDGLQPISLEPRKPEPAYDEQPVSLSETPNEPAPASDVLESPPTETAQPRFDLGERPAVSRDEVEEALSVLSNRLNMENSAEEKPGESELDAITPDAHAILSETDSTGIDVESFQAELSKLEFNDTWTMPEILTGSPQEPSTITQSESDEMAAFLAGIEAQTPQLPPAESSSPDIDSETQTQSEPTLVFDNPEPAMVIEPVAGATPVATILPEQLSEPEAAPDAVSPMEISFEPAARIEVAEPVSSLEPVQPVIDQPVEPESSNNDLFARMNELESPADSGGMATYTVALIPAADNLYIQRQNSAILSQTMNRLALAFNWTLESLTIRPTYMQWTLSMSAILPPEDMISIVRKETTAELKKANPEDLTSVGDDYWFPQTMSATGRDFVPSIHWQDFILRRKTREIA
jgi:hypothetical protein